MVHTCNHTKFVQDEQRESDIPLHRQYCQLLLNAFFFSFFFLMTGEVYFHLRCAVIAKNCRYWSPQNHHHFGATHLHDQKLGVWCAVLFFYWWRITGYFLEGRKRPAFNFILIPYYKKAGVPIWVCDCLSRHQQGHATMQLISEAFPSRANWELWFVVSKNIRCKCLWLFPVMGAKSKSVQQQLLNPGTTAWEKCSYTYFNTSLQKRSPEQRSVR